MDESQLSARPLLLGLALGSLVGFALVRRSIRNQLTLQDQSYLDSSSSDKQQKIRQAAYFLNEYNPPNRDEQQGALINGTAGGVIGSGSVVFVFL